jgi:hypothetical protein
MTVYVAAGKDTWIEQRKVSFTRDEWLDAANTVSAFSLDRGRSFRDGVEDAAADAAYTAQKETDGNFDAVVTAMEAVFLAYEIED